MGKRTPAKRVQNGRKRVPISASKNESMIELCNYPQLADIAWNRTQTRIPESEAFALYERNWRFIDSAHLIRRERNLIGRLAKNFGNGIIHANISSSSSPANR